MIKQNLKIKNLILNSMAKMNIRFQVGQDGLILQQLDLGIYSLELVKWDQMNYKILDVLEIELYVLGKVLDSSTLQHLPVTKKMLVTVTYGKISIMITTFICIGHSSISGTHERTKKPMFTQDLQSGRIILTLIISNTLYQLLYFCKCKKINGMVDSVDN